MISKLVERISDTVSTIREAPNQTSNSETITTNGDSGHRAPEDKVIELLEQRDGVAWQGEVAELLEWSPSKTSRVLSRMEDDTMLNRYRIGRKKIACLPGEVPDWLPEEEPSQIG